MTSVSDILQDQDFQGDAASASEYVIAANLDAQVADIKNKINELLEALARVVRDDDRLTDQIVDARAFAETALEVATGENFEVCVATASSNITLSGEQTIDNVDVVAGDRVLVAGQADDTENGIYVVAAGAWGRATDMAEGDTLTGPNFVYNLNGSEFGSYRWQVNAGDGLVVGTDELDFFTSGPVGHSWAPSPVTLDASSGAVEINTNQGQIFSIELTTNTEITMATMRDGTTFQVVIQQDDVGGRSLTWDGAIEWPSATLPTYSTAAGGKDIFSFTVIDGVVHGVPVLGFGAA